ncbi:MAG: hypothetical protein M9962_08095 [Oligoflexia bacterium]|nr:hypothetical protein [Oligoflexia bacterium]
MNIHSYEIALGKEASVYSASLSQINPYSETEVINFGSSLVVYLGTSHQTHGAFGFGIDSFDEKLFLEIIQFCQKKERSAYFRIHPEVCEEAKEEIISRGTKVFSQTYSSKSPSQDNSTNLALVDLNLWPLHYTKTLNRNAKEASLDATVISQQKQTRWYIEQNHASYTFFTDAMAIIPHGKNPHLLAYQESDAKKWGTQKILLKSGEFEDSYTVDTYSIDSV